MEADYEHYIIKALGFENPRLPDPQSSAEGGNRTAPYDALPLKERL